MPCACDSSKFPPPLTPAAGKSGWKIPGLTGTLDTAVKLNKLPVGGSLGLVAAAFLIWASPVELLSGLGALTIFLGIVGGMALQRLLKWLLGWYAELAIERAESRRQADLKIERVRYYQQEGILDEPAVKRFSLRIAREDLFGAPKPRGPRGPYKTRPPSPPSGNREGPEKPAA